MSIGNRVLAVFFGAVLAIIITALIYDRFAPVYSNARLTDVYIEGATVYGTLRMGKHRDCTAIQGTLVAFAHFVNVPQPVRYVDGSGQDLKLRDLPSRKEEYALPVGWKMQRSAPMPNEVSVTFRAKCGIFTRRYTLGRFDATPV